MKFLETQLARVAQQINTRAPNQFPSQPKQIGKVPSQINVLIEMEGNNLADIPLHEMSSMKPIGDTNYDTVCFESVELRPDHENGKKSRVTDIKIDFIPFPQKLAQAKLERKYEKFFKLLNDKSLESSFLDMLAKAPIVPKMFEDLLFDKHGGLPQFLS